MGNNLDYNLLTYKKVIIAVGVVVFLIILLANSVSVIPVGKVGIKTQFGEIKGNTLESGLNFKLPFIQNINKINCQVQKIEVNASAASKDMQTVTSKLAINYSIDKISATKLYKDIGVKYEEIIISPTIQETVKNITAQFTAEELIAKRSEVSNKISDNLIVKLKDKGINIIGVNIVNFDFSEAYNKAIEDKQVAQQNTLKAIQDLERIKVEAEQRIVNAKSNAEANRLLEQSLTAEILNQKAIEKWNGVLPVTIAGGTIPFVNIK
jgi:regulator of protease activity HflC (stomatin/prohibitin superfamily)